MIRPDWDTYFLSLAKAVATRSTCPRASVGAVIVKDKRVLATGYNGAPLGEPHCTEVGCLMENGTVRELSTPRPMQLPKRQDSVYLLMVLFYIAGVSGIVQVSQ